MDRTDPRGLGVEHVLPEKWKPEDYPLAEQSEAAKTTRSRLIHGIGNLTLVTPEFNTSLSNSAFSDKRPALAKESTLALNAYFQDLRDSDIWDEDRIAARAETLFALAVNAWPHP